MGLSVGLVGLPNAGKSTLFNALTAAGAEVGAYPFTTVGRNVGTLVVPDERLETISRLTRPAKTTPTSLEIVDIAGLVEGAHKGEGLGNQFLGHIREVDIILHVVRCFENSKVTHVYGGLDPARDAGVVDLELALADLGTLDRRLEKSRAKAKSGRPADKAEVAALEKIREGLAQGRPARALELGEAEAALLAELFLVTAKPQIYVANVTDSDFEAAAAGSGPPGYLELAEHGRAMGSPVVPVSAAIEADYASLADDERAAWKDELGRAVEGGASLVLAAYRHLDLVTFYTANENEARAHTIPRGVTAAKAAGKIHTDMEKGFIRAEVVAFKDLEAAGSMAGARQKGVLRVEGRDYVVTDGDILYFRFSPAA